MRKIAILRKERRLTLDQCAWVLGISRQHLIAYEHEERAFDYSGLIILINAAKLFGVKLWHVVDDENACETLRQYAKMKEMLTGFEETEWARIKLMRNCRNMSQTELAKAIGTKQSTISLWECGGYGGARLNTVLKLCSALSCHPCDVIDDPMLRNSLRRVL